MEADLGGVWVAEWVWEASIEPLPPPQAKSGKKMSSPPGIKLPVKKRNQPFAKNLIEILLKFVLNSSIHDFFIILSAPIQEHMSFL